MKLRRDMLLFGTLAVAALAGGWWLLANRPGAAVDAFANDARMRAAAAAPEQASVEAFRATICAIGPCVLVEAGGLAFMVGGGQGAAEELASRGLMRANLDAIFLADLSIEAIEGIPALARASLTAGRAEPLRVFGPPGIVAAIDGMNLMASGDEVVRLSVGLDKEDQGLEGVLVFDSGVVAVRAFGGRERGESRVYRIDFEGKSLVIAGCGAAAEQIVAASRGTQIVAGILAAGSARLAPNTCIDVTEALEAGRQARLKAILVSPLKPSAAIPGALAAWQEVVVAEKAEGAALGQPGSMLDLSGPEPVLKSAN